MDYKKFPRKINLGCGYDKRAGYLNVDVNDFHQPDLVADVADLSMLPDGYYQEAVAQDVLEHLGRTKTMEALQEWGRILEDGGILTIRVPNLLGLMDMLSVRNGVDMAKQKELVQCLYGTQAYEGDYHQTGFTKLLLADYLWQCGFGVRRMRSVDGWMMEVEARKGESEESGEVDLADEWLFLEGWYGPETRKKRVFRWGSRRAFINIGRRVGRELGFELFTDYPKVGKAGVEVVVVDVASGKVKKKVQLKGGQSQKVLIECSGGGKVWELFTNISWIPKYWQRGEDERELAIGITNLIWR